MSYFTKDDIELLIQWFHSILDVNPQYLEEKDYQLFEKIKVVMSQGGINEEDHF